MSGKPGKRKLLIIMDRRSLGGAPNNFLRLLETLDRDRFEPLVLVPYHSRLSQELSGMQVETWVRTIPAWRKFKYWPLLPFYLAELVLEIYHRGVDLVVALDVNETPLAVVSGWLTARPSLVCFQDSLISAKKSKIYWVHRSDYVVTVSKYMVEKVNQLPCRGQVELIYNGVDPDRSHGLYDGIALRKELGISSEDWVLLMVGRVVPSKGQIYLIQALTALKEEGIFPRVLLAGTFQDHYLTQLEEELKTRNLENQVFFLGYREEIGEVFAAADLFVTLSENESFSLALAEAMAMEKPSIYCPVGGIVELAGEKEIGIPVIRENITEIKEAIKALMSDPAKRVTMGQNARQRIKDHFTLEKQRSKFTQFLESIWA